MIHIFAEEIQRIELEIAQLDSNSKENHQESKRIFATTSCQSNSVVLLHLLQRFRPKTQVFFLNTGYLFPETLAFRDQLSDFFGLNITTLRSQRSPLQQLNTSGRQLYTSDPDFCCHINKVEPLEPILMTHDIWINGVRGTQSSIRSQMQRFQPTKHNVLRYHPLLQWDSRMIYYYIQEHNLPKHPLEDKGYKSIGCQPCTRSFFDDLDNREGRWQGMNKTECGLHTTLGISK